MGLEHEVEVTRVGEAVMSAVRATRGARRHVHGLVEVMSRLGRVEPRKMVGAKTPVAVQALDERVVERFEMSGGLPHARGKDDGGVEPDDVLS
jgi:hypothetical protein